MSISVLVASSGRPTLARTLASISPQLQAGDELVVDVNADGYWGHPARNRMMDRAPFGSWIVHIDDDDILTPQALTAVRALCIDPAPHIFRMTQQNGNVVWADEVVRIGNVGTPMMVARNNSLLGRFSYRYGGDFDYVASTVANCGGACIWHEDLIAQVRPHG